MGYFVAIKEPGFNADLISVTCGVFPSNLEACILPGFDFCDKYFLTFEKPGFHLDLISVTSGVFPDNLEAWISPGFDFCDKWGIS